MVKLGKNDTVLVYPKMVSEYVVVHYHISTVPVWQQGQQRHEQCLQM